MALNAEILEQSFDQIKPQASEFVARFYDILFTDYPQVQPLFANSDMKAQQQKLLKALVLVIENLRKPDVLTSALKGLGAQHVQYGTLPEHYPMVGRTLLKTFEAYLGLGWTPEVKQAWTDAYSAIAHLMLAGADYPGEILNLAETP
ncbi:MAG TPA: globin family protein [Candidatus Caenarcaniphilales bacterium]